MAAKLDNHEEESFIILGTSPGTSLDMKCNGTDVDTPLKKTEMEDAMKDLSMEANLAFKAHFKLGDCPSPSSMMAASAIVSETRSTEELQKSFGELLDENLVLKETLKQNNESLKDQFLLIASCQQDMLRTHQMHQEKFNETKELVERLRQENKKLKLDLSQLISNGDSSNQLNGKGDSLTKSVSLSEKSSEKSFEKSSDKSSDQPDGAKSGPPSVIEFVTSPDDDTINKLTAQLELVEKQRRQVIVENEKLTWQKESLENIVDATSKERDELKEKLKKVELHYLTKETEYQAEISNLKYAIEGLQRELQVAGSYKGISTEEVTKREVTIQELGQKVAALQSELKQAQLKILELESVKMEYTRQKSGTSEIAKLHKEQLQDLHKRLKEAQTTVFQPVRFSISEDSTVTSPEYSSFVGNVKLYDRTLKHLADLLNSMTHGTSENLLDTLGLVTSLHEFKLDRGTADRVKSGLNEVKLLLEKQHSGSLNNVGQIKSTLTIFEGIFQDFKELLKKGLTQQEQPSSEATKTNVDALTAALMARGRELDHAKEEILELQSKVMALHEDKEDKDLMKAQIEVYKSDFEAERSAREEMASERETIAADLRNVQKRNQELLAMLEEVRVSNPNVYHTVITKKRPLSATTARPATTATTATTAAATASVSSRPASAATTGNMVYKCPKCLRFSSDQYKVMEDHFDFCLDDF